MTVANKKKKQLNPNAKNIIGLQELLNINLVCGKGESSNNHLISSYLLS